MNEKTKINVRDSVYFSVGLVTGAVIYYIEDTGILLNYINSLL